MRDNEAAGHVMTDCRWGLHCSEVLRHKADPIVGKSVKFSASWALENECHSANLMMLRITWIIGFQF
jgi:hypothetical protein